MQNRFDLPQNEMPKHWYNALPDLPTPLAPFLDPSSKQALQPEQLEAIFPKGLIEQELSQERYPSIPEEVLDIYSLWRPTPLVRALNLEKAVNSKCRIYFKDESVSPAGSHKPNTAVAQAYFNKKEGVRRLATETGAGQWGTALSFACSMLDMECTVYMVKVSYEQKPYRQIMIKSYGATIHPSPSKHTKTGTAILEQDPDCKGSLGLAISEAVEDAAGNSDVKYTLGSVLNHVLLHQTISGLETELQLQKLGEKPDYIVGCVGGGSNFAGLALPFLPRKLNGENINFIAVEPRACPTLTRGRYTYDYGDMAGLTPLIKMHTLGHSFMPPPIHSGGLRYHGGAPLLCNLVHEGLVEPRAYFQNECFQAAQLFLNTQGFMPAPETSHAIRATLELAEQAEPGSSIVFLYSGHGLLDLASYEAYLQGRLTDYELSQEDIENSLRVCPET